MKYTQRGFIVQGIVAIVALVLIAGGAYYVSQKKISNPIVENTDTTTSVDTAGWKIYSNSKKMAFEIKYPATWEVSDDLGTRGDVVFISNPARVQKTEEDKPNEYVDIAPNGPQSPCVESDWEVGFKGVNYKLVCISSDGDILRVNLVAHDELGKAIEDKITASLRFTPPLATAKLKTYTNEKLGFEIKYPSDWEVNLNTGNTSIELVNSARKGKPDTDTPREVVSIDTIGTGGKITECVSTGWVVGFGGIFYKNICVPADPKINLSMSAFDEKGKEVVDSIISTFNFPSSATTSSESLPLITSIVPTSGPIGTKVELKGTGFSGFEGDKYAWIENTKTGVKGIIYNEPGATNTFIPFTLKDKYCTRDNSYSGNPCESYLTITPGEYTIHVYPWGKMSNKIKFTVTK